MDTICETLLNTAQTKDPPDLFFSSYEPFFFFLSVLKLLCSLLVLQAYGEEIVREVFPEATIIRPSDTFGHEDRLLNYYASLRVFPFGFVPMLDGGMKTYKRPVYVSGMSGMF